MSKMILEKIENYKQQKFYNDAYKETISYKTHYSESLYFHFWKPLMETIIFKYPKTSKILEIGCGSGQFGHYLYDCGYTKYLGIDFSEEAIKIAQTFSSQNYKTINYKDMNFDRYDLFILLEVIEHLEDDIYLIKKIPIGKTVIFSVPDFWYKSHVRVYDINKIKTRFSKYLNFREIIAHEHNNGRHIIYVVDGVRKDEDSTSFCRK